MSTTRDDLVELINRDIWPEAADLADAILAAGWRPPARTVSTVEELDALPAGVVVHSADGTIACRHYSGVGVVFGDERPFPWHVLALPLTVIHEGSTS